MALTLPPAAISSRTLVESLALAARMRSRSVSIWASGRSWGGAETLDGTAADDDGPGLALDVAVELGAGAVELPAGAAGPAVTGADAELEGEGAAVVHPARSPRTSNPAPTTGVFVQITPLKRLQKGRICTKTPRGFMATSRP
ncbi:Flagellar hook-associated protein flgK [Arthrobacter sp. 9V]|nr:Flagellar hook-associated protein flgK [Arthrobacter sp. 9V]